MGELVGRRAINSHHDEGSLAPCTCCSPGLWARRWIWPWWHGWLWYGRVWIWHGRVWIWHGRFWLRDGWIRIWWVWWRRMLPHKEDLGKHESRKGWVLYLVMDSNMMEDGMGYGSGSGMGSDSGEG